MHFLHVVARFHMASKVSHGPSLEGVFSVGVVDRRRLGRSVLPAGLVIWFLTMLSTWE